MQSDDYPGKEESEGSIAMKYFCDVHVQSKKDQEKRLFIVIPDDAAAKMDTPNLTKEMLLQNTQYQEFVSQYRPRLVLADYTVYETEEDRLYSSTQDEEFIALIASGNIRRIARSELVMDSTRDKLTNGKKRHKSSPAAKALLVGCMILVAFGFGKMVGSGNTDAIKTEELQKANENGMLIPDQQDIAADQEQLTVSIDRSYSAVPTEDLQLKGAVVNGTAAITLPEYDREDFFTHVPGYTWGFSTKPDGDRIEFYGGKTYSFRHDTKLYRVLVKYGGGSGTKEDPYLIDYYDQLELMGKEKARGYFKQSADIVFPEWAEHKPINTTNRLKNNPNEDCFEYDGNGFKIENLTDSLFGKVSGAVIKNVNIINSNVTTSEYSNFGFIVCEAYNYRYQTEDGTSFETGETLILDCTVSHSTFTAEIPAEERPTEEYVTEIITAPVVAPPDDVVIYDEEGNVIEKTQDTTEPPIVEPTKYGEYAVGAVSGLGGQIENCYVEDFAINANLEDYILYAGGISGKPANVLNCAVYNFGARGRIFNAGGIAGSIAGSKLYDPKGKELPTYYGGSIQGCAVIWAFMQTELAAGGIAGEGSTNADHAIISNCYTKALGFDVGIYQNVTKIKDGMIGGILGTDGNEPNGHLIGNTVSPSDFGVIGAQTVSRFDDTARLAPEHAYYQENIQTVINRSSIHPNNPKEMFTGSFKFDANHFSDEGGALAYPSEIEELFARTLQEATNG